MRVGTLQHLPTFASKSGIEPSTGLMDRDTQHRPISPTTRAHQLTTVGRHALLLGTVDDTYTGRLLTTQDTQKYVKWAVFGTEPTNTRANVHNPLSLQLLPPRDYCLHASVHLGRQKPSTSKSPAPEAAARRGGPLQRPRSRCCDRNASKDPLPLRRRRGRAGRAARGKPAKILVPLRGLAAAEDLPRFVRGRGAGAYGEQSSRPS